MVAWSFAAMQTRPNRQAAPTISMVACNDAAKVGTWLLALSPGPIALVVLVSTNGC
jgi:hypothetical protein